MNKDLEIIKQNEPYRCIDFEDYKVGFDSIKWRAVIEAAVRMVAEIARLKEEVNETQAVYYSVLKESIQYRDEIARLKAELEKRPEVVYCEGCIYKNQCKAAVIFQESTPKMEGPFKFYYLKFCSYGQRRESKEGK